MKKKNKGNGKVLPMRSKPKQVEVTTVTLTPEAAVEVKTAELNVMQQQTQLGAIVEDFEARKAAAIAALSEARRQYFTLIEVKGKEAGAALGEGAWNYDASNATYTKTG